jgi:hypothetical protein
MAKTLTATDRSALIRLASTMEKGSVERRAILAGVRQAGGRYNERDVEDMEPDTALDMLDDLTTQAGRKAHEYVRHYQLALREAEENLRDLTKAWDKWDWQTLAKFNVVTEDEADFAREVLASYT